MVNIVESSLQTLKNALIGQGCAFINSDIRQFTNECMCSPLYH